ncbi:transmembrane protein 201 isoform X2 [Denticeps clupeoides]|uniref:transmembrane protein 201 isoform X2 n=1 Tax=Denticeps clupeoides TaxID=299321 RepID=UPI0010A37379|nr:transmembrane protein 201 isoform X2 [Denticeps clupeoides]
MRPPCRDPVVLLAAIDISPRANRVFCETAVSPLRCFLLTSSATMDAFSQMLFEHPQLVYGGFGATACAAGGALLYRIATRKKPTHVIVNCWFCDQDTVVPYGNRNCWDCPSCDQYNGFQENGDYNKPIPAQYMEHLNHGISAGLPALETPKTLQWVNCQMLLCKKCNHNQTLKIKQLASFTPREDDNYDEEIEVYKHHLEQTYKLCRPCQTAVEYYIKHQNRQLRAQLFNYQLRCSRDVDKASLKNTYSLSTPAKVIFLRVLAFLFCMFLVSVSLIGYGEASGSPAGISTAARPPLNSSGEGSQVWAGLLYQLPEEVLENARMLWYYASEHQVGVASIGLFTCITGVVLAGQARMRRIDAVASILWFLVTCLYLAEIFSEDVPDWLGTAKFGSTSLCCLVGFTAAVATRKSMGQRRTRGRRYLPGSSRPGPLFPEVTPGSPAFVPSPPPNLAQLLTPHHSQRGRKASPSSLPSRLNRALSLGTIPSLTRTDSGCLFSGSRPSSQCKDSSPSGSSILSLGWCFLILLLLLFLSIFLGACTDYFSLKSGSRHSSPGPSPTPSLAGSVTSTSSSARHRRPLISPARLNIGGRKLQLFSSSVEPHLPLPCVPEPSHVSHNVFMTDTIPFSSHHQDLSSLLEVGSVSERVDKRTDCSSGSSHCNVDTTTGSDCRSGWKGLLGHSIWPCLLVASLTGNLLFCSVYLHCNWR